VNRRKIKTGMLSYFPVFASCFAFFAAFFFFRDGMMLYCAEDAKKTFRLFALY